MRGDYVKIEGLIKYIDPKFKFPPDVDFRFLTVFTSDLSLAYSAVVNYSLTAEKEIFVRLSYPFLTQEIAERLLGKKTEIILLDPPYVRAVCTSLVFKGVCNDLVGQE